MPKKKGAPLPWKVTVREIATGQELKAWPVDARELIRSGEYEMIEDPGVEHRKGVTPTAAPKQDPSQLTVPPAPDGTASTSGTETPSGDDAGAQSNPASEGESGAATGDAAGESNSDAGDAASGESGDDAGAGAGAGEGAGESTEPPASKDEKATKRGRGK